MSSGLEVAVSTNEAEAASAISPVQLCIGNGEAIPVAIKVCTRHQDWYRILPRKAIVAPNATCLVTVFLKPPAGTEQLVHGTADAASVADPTGVPADAPSADLLRVDIRLLVSLSAKSIDELDAVSSAEFETHWANGIPQTPIDVPVKLHHLTALEYIDHVAANHAEERDKAESELADARRQLAAGDEGRTPAGRDVGVFGEKNCIESAFFYCPGKVVRRQGVLGREKADTKRDHAKHPH